MRALRDPDAGHRDVAVADQRGAVEGVEVGDRGDDAADPREAARERLQLAGRGRARLVERRAVREIVGGIRMKSWVTNISRCPLI